MIFKSVDNGHLWCIHCSVLNIFSPFSSVTTSDCPVKFHKGTPSLVRTLQKFGHLFAGVNIKQHTFNKIISYKIIITGGMKRFSLTNTKSNYKSMPG